MMLSLVRRMHPFDTALPISIVGGTLPLELFRRDAYGTRLGWVSAARQLTSAFAPFAFALMMARTTVTNALWILAVTSAGGVLAFLAIALITRLRSDWRRSPRTASIGPAEHQEKQKRFSGESDNSCSRVRMTAGKWLRDIAFQARKVHHFRNLAVGTIPSCGYPTRKTNSGPIGPSFDEVDGRP